MLNPGGLIQLILALTVIWLFALTSYLLFLTAAAVWAARRSGSPQGTARRRFAILVPAHNEELSIGRLLASLGRLDYPHHAYDIWVVADNCDDQTAAIAREAGARVRERFDATERAKGFALRWLLARIREERCRYDAYVVLDADSVVASNLLRSMDARLEYGAQVVQAYYSVLNGRASTLSGLRSAALAALHFLRPLGRSVFGWSCGLKGNGMCFASPVIEEFAWRWYTLAEDVEFHLALVARGLTVQFAPETWVAADMPVSFRQAGSQNARWERGRVQLLRHHALPLLGQGLRRRSLARLDAALEQLIPPLSVPFALSATCLVLAAMSGAWLTATLASVSLAGQVTYLLAALALVRAPARDYLALGAAPIYIAWKVGLYAQAVLGGRTTRWVRTARAAGEVS